LKDDTKTKIFAEILMSGKMKHIAFEKIVLVGLRIYLAAPKSSYDYILTCHNVLNSTKAINAQYNASHNPRLRNHLQMNILVLHSEQD